MSSNDVCQEIRPLLAGYALGALDPEERDQVDRHLPACPSCRLALAEFTRVADGLLELVPPQPPPSAIRRRLEAQLGRQPDKPTAGRPRWAGWPRLALGLGLAALVGLNLLMLSNLAGLAGQVESLSRQVERNQTGLALMTYPTSHVVELQGESVFGTLVYDPGGRVVVVYAWGLPRLPAGQAYQAWFRQGDQDRVSGGLFQAQDPDSFTVIVLEAPEPVAAYAGLGITIEPAAGSPGPTSPSVFTADF